MFRTPSFRKLCLIGILLLGYSCNLFTSREKHLQQEVDKEMQSINWNEVDQLPLFIDCDETEIKSEQKACFENTLVLHLSMTLQDFDFSLPDQVEDTLYVDFLVDQQGGISVLSVDTNDQLERALPEFEGIVSRSLKSLPKLQPALKRGLPVTTKFRIPLVLTTTP